MVYDGDDGVFLYLDGVSDSAELENSGTTAQMNCVLRYVGVQRIDSSASNNRYFNGQIRDVKIMPSALSAGEIRKLYSGENPKKNLYFEMVTDGTFTNTANWVEGTGWSIGAAGATHTGSSSYITQTPIVNYVEGQWYVATCDCTLTSGGLYLVNHTTPSPVDVQFTISGSRAYAVWYQSSVNLSSTNVYATGNVTITNLKISKVGTLLDFNYRSASSTKWYNQAIPDSFTGVVNGTALSAGSTDHYVGGDLEVKDKLAVGNLNVPKTFTGTANQPIVIPRETHYSAVNYAGTGVTKLIGVLSDRVKIADNGGPTIIGGNLLLGNNWSDYGSFSGAAVMVMPNNKFLSSLNNPASENTRIIGLNASNQVSIAPGSEATVFGGTITENSSIAIKENIFDLNTTLDKINRVRPVKYNKKVSKNKKEIGFIAEELAEIFPELVENDENGNPTSVNYTRAVTVLFDGFKQMYKELKEIKERIK